MDQIDAKSVGRRVAAHRRAIGMTAEDLARELGPEITGNAITKLERGHRAQVSPGMVVDLARALGVSPLAILFPLDEPDAEIVIGGMRGTVRSFGAWLLGEFPHADIVTQTFRQLVAADRAVDIAEAAERGAAPNERSAARQRADDERYLRSVLEAHLLRMHAALFEGSERVRENTLDDDEHFTSELLFTRGLPADELPPEK